MTDFFILDRAPAGSPIDKDAGTECIQAEGTNIGDARRCAECGGYIGMREWLPPYRVELETWGRRFADVIIESTDTLLVSEMFRDLYQATGLTGLSGFSPVEVVRIVTHGDQLHGVPPAYYKTDVARSRAAVDLEESEFEWKNAAPICPECREARRALKVRWKRIVIEPGTWQREDIFTPRGVSGPLTSQRFKDMCDENALAGTYFIPADEYAVDFWRGANMTTWRLSHGRMIVQSPGA